MKHIYKHDIVRYKDEEEKEHDIYKRQRAGWWSCVTTRNSKDVLEVEWIKDNR